MSLVNSNYIFITFFSWYLMAIFSRAKGSPHPVPSLTTASTSWVPRQRSINSQAKFIHCSNRARYSFCKTLYLIQYCNRAHGFLFYNLRYNSSHFMSLSVSYSIQTIWTVCYLIKIIVFFNKVQLNLWLCEHLHSFL